MKRLILLLIPFAFISCGTQSNEKWIHVKSVHDGDTFTDENNIRYRILGADTPEVSSGEDFKPTIGLEKMYGQMATNYVRNLILNKDIRIEKVKVDKFGRTVAKIFIGKTTLSELLVEKGLARVAYISNVHTNSRFNPVDYFYRDEEYIKRLYDKQMDAAKKRLGFWHDISSYDIIFPKSK